MCIRDKGPDVLTLDVAAPMDYRDRLTHVARLRAEVTPHRADIVMGSIASAVDAVSYTHLDVYKRQAQGR